MARWHEVSYQHHLARRRNVEMTANSGENEMKSVASAKIGVKEA
jgi:hypothetical protein